MTDLANTFLIMGIMLVLAPILLSKSMEEKAKPIISFFGAFFLGAGISLYIILIQI